MKWARVWEMAGVRDRAADSFEKAGTVSSATNNVSAMWFIECVLVLPLFNHDGIMT